MRLIGSVKLIIVLMLLPYLPEVQTEKKRQLEAHEHGHGTLNIAVEKNFVVMKLAVPGSDVVGFEHDAKTESEKRQVSTAVTKLKAILVR